MGQTIFCLDATLLPVTHASVVNDRVKSPQQVDFFSHATSLCNACEVSHDRCLCIRNAALGIASPLLVARMQHHLVALFDQQLGSHETKSIG